MLVHDPAADLVSAEARISVASSPVELQALVVPDILEASKPLSYRVVKNGEDWNSAPLQIGLSHFTTVSRRAKFMDRELG